MTEELRCVHLGLKAIFDFEMKEGFLPQPNNAQHAAKCVALAKALNDANKKEDAGTMDMERGPLVTVEEVNEKVITRMALHAAVELHRYIHIYEKVITHMALHAFVELHRIYIHRCTYIDRLCVCVSVRSLRGVGIDI
jgi:hypothetical protein